MTGALALKFCPKCRGLMRPAKIRDTMYLVCTRCGYKVEASNREDLTAYARAVKVQHSPRDKILVIDSAEMPQTASLVKGQTSCPKCGHDEVYVWMMQTRSADEPPTRFYRCAKCKYTWREYA